MPQYSRQVAEDFCKALEESKLIVKGSSKKKIVIDNFLELINITEEEAEKISPAVSNLRHEFSDWIETYHI